MTDVDDKFFEDEVRRIARQLWPEDRFSGSIKMLGRERDGIFITEDIVNIVEATTSRKKAKAVDDVDKIVSLARALRKEHPDKVVKGWFVTSHEPEADQRSVTLKHAKEVRIIACSFDTFRSRLVDAGSYLELRQRYRFGSIVNLENEAKPLARGEYVPLDIVNSKTNELVSLDGLSDAVSLHGHRFLLLGDYGAGKSMTLREVFFKLREQYIAKKSTKFPLYINLRDHHSQNDPDEALSRHAGLIGLLPKEQLVRAWRAGYVDLLLDGFDELATAGWVGATKKLKQIRFQTMELVREIIRQSPQRVGLVLSGRKHYFDSDNEMHTALATGESFTELALNEFTDIQIAEFLKKKGVNAEIPEWLPSRPLLLGYLIAHGILKREDMALSSLSPAEGWAYLLRRICDRESRIGSGIEPDSVQQIVERLASICRAKSDGLGPIYGDELNATFQEIVGYPPDDRGQMLLMRLPGLGPTTFDDGSRRFIDADLVDAARAGDVVRYIADPFSFPFKVFSAANMNFGDIGSAITALKCVEMGWSSQKISVACTRAAQDEGGSILAVDITNSLAEAGLDYTGENIVIRDVLLETLRLADGLPNFSAITFQGCLFGKLEIDRDINVIYTPHFRDCHFEIIEGRVSQADLPVGVFEPSCTFGDFSDLRTNAEIFSLDLPEGTKVLLSVLKKLFIQKGAGRREPALSRGLDHRARRLVKDVLSIINTEKVAVRVKMRDYAVWLPLRDQAGRVRRILAAPSASSDPLVTRSANIS